MHVFPGDNVVDFFFRAAALTFDAAVLREVESGPSHPRQIGNDLVSKSCVFNFNGKVISFFFSDGSSHCTVLL